MGLADAAAYDDRYKKWRYEDLPILPAPFRYVVSEEKAAQFHILRSLMESPDVTELVNACDAGREGKLIFRLVYEAAGCSKPFSRLWISSMEDAAIREGFSDLRPGKDYDPLYQSALCRQKADWLIGINASRLFSVLYHRTLNVGRGQTPTLAMLADRDSKIVLFRKEKYHHVRLALEGTEAVSEKSRLWRMPRPSGTPVTGSKPCVYPWCRRKGGEAAQAVRPNHLAAGGKPGVQLHGQANPGLRPIAL